jgi:hypothetical protein
MSLDDLDDGDRTSSPKFDNINRVDPSSVPDWDAGYWSLARFMQFPNLTQSSNFRADLRRARV